MGSKNLATPLNVLVFYIKKLAKTTKITKMDLEVQFIIRQYFNSL